MNFNDAIKYAIDRGYITWNSVRFAYINWANLINQIWINRTTKDLKGEFWYSYKEKLSISDLEKLKKAERLIINFITTWISLKQLTKIFNKTKKLWTSLI